MSVLGGNLQSYFINWQGRTGIIGFVESEVMLNRFSFKFLKGDATKTCIAYEEDIDTISKFGAWLHKIEDSFETDEELARQVDSILKNGNPFGPARYEIKLYFNTSGQRETIYCRDWGYDDGMIWYSDIKDAEEVTNYIPVGQIWKIVSKEIWDGNNDNDSVSDSGSDIRTEG